LKIDDVAALLFVEQVEVDFETKKFLVFKLLVQVNLLVCDFSISLLQLFLFFLQRSDFFINLLFHHLVQILLLDVQLLHDPSERFLESVYLFVELFPYFQLQLAV